MANKTLTRWFIYQDVKSSTNEVRALCFYVRPSSMPVIGIHANILSHVPKAERSEDGLHVSNLGRQMFLDDDLGIIRIEWIYSHVKGKVILLEVDEKNIISYAKDEFFQNGEVILDISEEKPSAKIMDEWQNKVGAPKLIQQIYHYALMEMVQNGASTPFVSLNNIRLIDQPLRGQTTSSSPVSGKPSVSIRHAYVYDPVLGDNVNANIVTTGSADEYASFCKNSMVTEQQKRFSSMMEGAGSGGILARIAAKLSKMSLRVVHDFPDRPTQKEFAKVMRRNGLTGPAPGSRQ